MYQLDKKGCLLQLGTGGSRDMYYKLIPFFKALLFCGGCFFFITFNNAFSVENECSAPTQFIEIASGVFVRQGKDGITFEDHNIANIGFIVGTQCVALIDSGGSRAEGESLKCAVRERTDLPICYVINTHVHPDHFMGNVVFNKRSTAFIGHKNLPQAITLAALTYSRRATSYEAREVSHSELVMPSIVVKDSLRIDIGNRVLNITAHPTSHTNNDLSLYDDKTRTLWLSDLLFTTHTPVLTGSINGWLTTLNSLKSLSADRVVPGHGPISASWPDAADKQLDYLTTLRERVRIEINAGTSLLKVQEELMQDNPWHWTLYDEFRKRNIINAYAELEWE